MSIRITVAEFDYVDPRANSDKFYRFYVQGTTLRAQYGRNGTSGSWVAAKDYGTVEAVTAALDKAIAARLGKGYSPARSGVLEFGESPTDAQLHDAVATLPFTGGGVAMPVNRPQAKAVTAVNAAPAAQSDTQAQIEQSLAAQLPPMTVTPLFLPTRPMLAESLPASDLTTVMHDPHWSMQPKLDGDRIVIEVTDGQVTALNRQGQPKAKNVTEAMLAPFRAFTTGRWVFDGEVIGATLHLFDMPAGGSYFDETAPFYYRIHALHSVLRVLAADQAHVTVVPTTYTTEGKRAMLEDAVANRREGVILRAQAASYQAGRRSPDLLKYKFIKEIDAEVVEVGRDGKANAVLAVYTASGERVIVGQVSTIGKGDITVGTVVEVSYLYIVNPDRPALYQPRIVRVRTDKAAAECSIEQLANAVTDKGQPVGVGA